MKDYIRWVVPTLLNAIFWPSHEISHLTGHHTTIDCVYFLMSGYLLQLIQFSREYTPDFRQVSRKKQSQVLKSGNPGQGHEMSPKVPFLRTYCSVPVMQCSTIHCFIAILKWHEIPRKINKTIDHYPLSHPNRLITTAHCIPSVTCILFYKKH